MDCSIGFGEVSAGSSLVIASAGAFARIPMIRRVAGLWLNEFNQDRSQSFYAFRLLRIVPGCVILMISLT